MRLAQRCRLLTVSVWLIGQSVVAVTAQHQPVAGGPRPEANADHHPDPHPVPPVPVPPADPDPLIYDLPLGAALAWDQESTAAAQASQLAFTLFVDGVPLALEGVRCTSTSSAAVESCDAPVPALSVGIHTLSLAAVDGGDESASSEPILVRVGSDVGTARQATLPALPGARPETLFDDPTDVVVMSSQVSLVAERAGTVRLVRDGRLEPVPALTLRDITTGDGRGLLALAAGPDVSSARTVYGLYSTTAGLRVTRYQLVGNLLLAPAVIIDALPMSERHPMGTLRVGPDGTLFVALGDGGRPDRAADLGDWTGKLLRFNLDGTTPRDQPAGSPVVLSGLQGPTSLAWDDHEGTLWLADRAADGSLLLHHVAPAGQGPVAVTRLRFPEAVGAASIALRGAPGALAMWAAVVSERGTSLGIWRITPTGDGMRLTDRDLALADGAPVRVLMADGASGLVFCTANAVGRMNPEPR